MLHKSCVKRGDILITDGGFTCIRESTMRRVEQSDGRLYIKCDDGKHFLDGQCDDEGNLIGLNFPTIDGMTNYIYSGSRRRDEAQIVTMRKTTACGKTEIGAFMRDEFIPALEYDNPGVRVFPEWRQKSKTRWLARAGGVILAVLMVLAVIIGLTFDA